MYRSAVWAAVVGLGVLIAAAVPARAETRISVTGAPGARFAIECVVFRPGGDRRLLFEGAVPFERVLDGAGLDCTIRQTSSAGWIEITVRRDESVSISRVGGRNATTRLRMQ